MKRLAISVECIGVVSIIAGIAIETILHLDVGFVVIAAGSVIIAAGGLISGRFYKGRKNE